MCACCSISGDARGRVDRSRNTNTTLALLRHYATVPGEDRVFLAFLPLHAEPYTPLVVILALPSTDPQTVVAAADLFASFSPLPASVIQTAMAPYLRQAAAQAGTAAGGVTETREAAGGPSPPPVSAVGLERAGGAFSAHTVPAVVHVGPETGVSSSPVGGAGTVGASVSSVSSPDADSAPEGLQAREGGVVPRASGPDVDRAGLASPWRGGDTSGARTQAEEGRETTLPAPPRTDDEAAAAVAVEMLAEESAALASEPSIAAATLWGMTQAAALNLSPVAAFHVEVPDFFLTVAGYQVPGFIGRLVDRGLRYVIDMMGIRAIPLPPIPRIAAVPILAAQLPEAASSVRPSASEEDSVSSASSPPSVAPATSSASPVSSPLSSSSSGLSGSSPSGSSSPVSSQVHPDAAESKPDEEGCPGRRFPIASEEPDDGEEAESRAEAHGTPEDASSQQRLSSEGRRGDDREDENRIEGSAASEGG
ncbi:conserved hypothetical protein [Neospora caninum Liverpool]|uniref:Uncharacterized protein n=1 Tax=Neospora caninum (strain Liverpool) TaxID=572307 RepID=F0VHN7_NEOCL|nr:conserved hypothetical protein [Neospora caninum Liverpool]CBZ53248.1 conserved hypothetical protein [Neospora caninum Liverpool]|eukprot:XP_003883280.1 conserved hypothetical protein [Neospora caninum Liverpool]